MKFSDRPNCLFRAHIDIYFILSFTCQCCQISYLTQRKNIKLYISILKNILIHPKDHEISHSDHVTWLHTCIFWKWRLDYNLVVQNILVSKTRHSPFLYKVNNGIFQIWSIRCFRITNRYVLTWKIVFHNFLWRLATVTL